MKLISSIDKHTKYFNSSDVDLFCILVKALKNSVTEDAYNREKTRLFNLISKEPEFCERLLINALDHWENMKYWWIMAIKSNIHNVSWSNLAEVAQAIIKVGGESNVSLS